MDTETPTRGPTQTAHMTIPFVKNVECPEVGSYTIYDEEQPGLALRLSPGSKTWIVRRKLRGKSFRHVLGRYPTMTLPAARSEAKKAIGAFEEGRHPTLERESRKQATKAEWLATRFTVGEMWAEYRTQPREEKPFSANYKRDFDRLEKRMKGDAIWSTPIATLTEPEVLASFKRIRVAAGKGAMSSNGGKTTANSFFRMLRSAARYAINHGRLASGKNIFSVALENNWHKSRARARTLVADKDSLRRWWTALDDLRAKGNASARSRASATLADYQVLVLLWGGRKTETLCLRWEDIDFERKTVRFREEVTKSRKEHCFPLASHAESVLRRLQTTRDAWSPDSQWVFPATKTGWKTKTKTHIKEPAGAMREVAAAANVPFSTHDIRRTFSNLLASAAGVGAEQTFVKLAMNHSVADDVTAEHYMDKAEQLRPLYEEFERVVLERVGVAAPKKIEVDAEAYRRFLAFEAQRSSAPRSKKAS